MWQTARCGPSGRLRGSEGGRSQRRLATRLQRQGASRHRAGELASMREALCVPLSMHPSGWPELNCREGSACRRGHCGPSQAVLRQCCRPRP